MGLSPRYSYCRVRWWRWTRRWQNRHNRRVRRWWGRGWHHLYCMRTLPLQFFFELGNSPCQRGGILPIGLTFGGMLLCVGHRLVVSIQWNDGGAVSLAQLLFHFLDYLLVAVLTYFEFFQSHSFFGTVKLVQLLACRAKFIRQTVNLTHEHIIFVLQSLKILDRLSETSLRLSLCLHKRERSESECLEHKA